METYTPGECPQTPDLFENEESTLENLNSLLSTPVGFNSTNDIDPWHPSFSEIRGDNIFPLWFYEFYKGYNCIDRLIILVQRNNYFRSERNKKYELAFIGGAYAVNLKNNFQYHINNPTKQR